MVFGPDGHHLYVSSYETDEVLRYDTTGAFIDAFVSSGSGGLDNPEGLIFGPDGNLYVSSGGTDEVLRYKADLAAAIDDVPSDAVAMLLSYPNPFADATTIVYTLTAQDAATEVSLVVYNMLGQRLRVLVQGHRQPGEHRIRWDGRDEAGRLVPTGVYLYRLAVGDRHVTRQLVRLR
jgi:DNA-binding beta-propeller fold protein YncE